MERRGADNDLVRLPVYVIHWNAPEWCAETVASLLASDGVGVEVTVIDNASRKLPQLPREVTLEKLPKNVGFSGGANQALRLHRARAEREEFFCIVCHDLHVEAAALRTCLEIARAYPGYGILGLNGTDLPEREGPIIDHDWVSGTCLFLRRDCADDVGWFDEIYGSYVEDIDFSYRAARKGWKLGIVTAARASAHGSVDSRRAIILTRANHTLLAAKQGDYGLAFSRLAGMAWRTLTMRGDLWPASFVQTARHLGRWMFRGGGHHGSRAITFPSRVTIDRFWVASQVLRFVPSGLGAHALARMTLASAARSPIRRRQTLHGGARFELDLSDRAQAQTYVIRRYEPDVSRFIAKKARRGGVFFDVGANIGLISFSVAVRRPDLSIHAFEADPANAERWRRNLELNLGVTAQLE
jgi:GT2 family glycosyltransferase